MILIECIFPLKAEIWGTVSDWVMIIVTIVTAYFLYHSLKSQRELTRMEQARFIDSIKPDLKVDDTASSFSFNAIFLQFVGVGNTAYKLSFDRLESKAGKVEKGVEWLNTTNRETLEPNQMKYFNLIVNDYIQGEEIKFNLRFVFHDSLDNKYSKVVEVTVDQDKKFTTISQPALRYGF